MADIIHSFTKEYHFLSNRYACDIEYEGVCYPNAEAAFEALRSANLAKGLDAAGSAASTDWDTVRTAVMRNLLQAKFENPALRVLLLQTGNAELVKGNREHDNILGDCTCKSCQNIHGENLLGKMLMELRADFFAQLPSLYGKEIPQGSRSPLDEDCVTCVCGNDVEVGDSREYCPYCGQKLDLNAGAGAFEFDADGRRFMVSRRMRTKRSMNLIADKPTRRRRRLCCFTCSICVTAANGTKQAASAMNQNLIGQWAYAIGGCPLV